MANDMHQTSEPTHLSALDGLRGFGLIPVLLGHAYLIILANENHVSLLDFMVNNHSRSLIKVGWISVDLFFVLSGFLVTRMLLASKEDPERIQNFYWRRFFRIAPVYYAFLFIVFVIQPCLAKWISPDIIAQNPLKYIFFLQNFFRNSLYSYMLIPTWSLATEVMFYLAVPWMIYHISWRTLVILLISAILVMPLARYIASLYWLTAPGAIYTGSLFRFDTFFFGMLVALWFEYRFISNVAFYRITFAGAWFLFPCIIILLVLTDPASPPIGTHNKALNTLAYSLIAFSAASIISQIALPFPSFIRKFFLNPFLRYLGKISYCVYVTHYMILVNSFRFLPVEWKYVPVILGFNIVLAGLSWRFFEKPLIKFSARHFGSFNHSQTNP